MKKRIAIIGMGVSGLAVLLAFSHLSQEELATLELVCFDDTQHFGRGIPFQKDDTSALINSPIDDISFDYRHMDDFVKWLTENKLDTNHPYVSRSLYGQYMSDRAETLMKKLPITRVYHKVDHVSYFPDSHEWQLVVNGQTFPHLFTEIHLACGQLPVLDPYKLQGEPNYIANPYPLKSLNLSLEEMARPVISVIGTGLAAVDVIKWLLLKSSASIIAFSRSNYFPTVRIIKGPSIKWQFFTEQFLDKVLKEVKPSFDLAQFEKLFLGELQNLGFSDWEQVEEQFLAVGIEGIQLSLSYPEQLYALQQLASRVTDCFTDLWPLMPTADREAFQKTYGKAIINLRNPMPEESARVLLEAVKEKRLTVAQNISDIVSLEEDLVLKSEEKVETRVKTAINATGYHLVESNLQNASPLLQNLIESKLCQIDTFGGLSILPETSQILSPKYGVLPTLFAHGALINGTIFQNNSTIKIQKMAERAIKIKKSLLKSRKNSF